MSTAIGNERVSRVLGYKLTGGNFNNTTRNLPQRVAIISEANTANQSGLVTTGFQITSAQQAGQRYGYGSPIHMIARILFPQGSDGIGGIPVIVYPIAEPGGATAKIINVEPSGTATGNGTHTIYIAGRAGLEGGFYNINITTGDTVADICSKIEDAVNAVLGSPVGATDNGGYDVDFTSKWKGLTADDITVTIDNNGNTLGITYTITSTQSGSGTPSSIAGALNQFGNEWVTLVINGYGTQSTILSALETFNGRPDVNNPTGRYAGTVWKPFVAITGSTADDPSNITDARLNDVTIAIAPAPLSAGLHFEAAANMTLLQARKAQDTPHLDVAGSSYPDMPVPLDGNIGSMAAYNSRDIFVKKGCSTVSLIANRYVVQDFVTTYHPIGEEPPQFRFVRNLFVDFNVQFGYYILLDTFVVGKAIAADSDTVTVGSVIKPKDFKALINTYASDLGTRALIADVAFMQNNITVVISGTNADRFNVQFRYKRSGTVRIVSTDVQAGFFFGN